MVFARVEERDWGRRRAPAASATSVTVVALRAHVRQDNIQLGVCKMHSGCHQGMSFNSGLTSDTVAVEAQGEQKPDTLKSLLCDVSDSLALH